MAGLGNLVVSLTAETAQFTAAMNRAAAQSQKNFNTITGAVKTAGGVLAAFASARTIQSYTQSLIDQANVLKDVSDRTGILAEEISRLGVAASLAGSSQEDINQGLQRFSRALGEAQGGTASYVKTFKDLGVSIADSGGQLLPTTEVFYQFVDAIAAIENPARAAAEVQAVLGKGSERLIPLFRQGSAALKEYNAQFSDQFIRDAQAFNDNVKTLSQNFDRLAATILGPVVTAINALFGTPVGKELDAAIDATKQRIEDLQVSIGITSVTPGRGLFGSSEDAVKRFRAELTKAQVELARLEALRPAPRPTGTAGTVAPSSEELARQKTINDLLERQRGELNALMFTKESLLLLDLALAGATDEQIRQAQAFSAAIKEQTDAARARAEGAALIEQLRTPVEVLGSELSKLQGLLDAGAISWEIYTRGVERANDAFDATVIAAQRQADAVRRAQESAREALFAGLRTEEEELILSYDRRREAILKATEITELERNDLLDRLAEEFNRKQQERQDALNQGILRGGEALFSGLAGLAKAAGSESSKAYRVLFAASKAFAIADATIKLQQAIANASISAPFPANLAAMAAIGAQVGALISTISSTNYAGQFAKGGTIPRGKWGIAGEIGPEIVMGPAQVVSTADTAAMMRQKPESNIRIINAFDSSVISDYLGSDAGEEVVLNVVRRNQGTIRGLVAA
jgi:hypothetical protein